MNKNQESRTSTVSSPEAPAPYRPRHSSRYDAEAWEVSVHLPGATRDEIAVTVEDEVLEVVARRHLKTPESWRPLGRDESRKSWYLRLDVGPEVDGSRISARLEDGILTLRLPLREEVKARRIEIH